MKPNGFGNYTVIRKEDEIKMGLCGLHDREGLEGIDIGFTFLPDYEGQGYTFKAARKILNQGFEVFLLQEIIAITFYTNTNSRSLLKKLGLHFEETITLPNDTEEVMFYRIISPKH